MKNTLILSSLLISIIILSSCEKNSPPSCEITTPANNTVIIKGTSIDLSVNAKDIDDNLIKIEYYIDNVNIGTSTEPPFNYYWTANSIEDGNHILKAIAIDEKGKESEDYITVITTTGETVSDIDGNTYKALQIGDQTWMAENLRVTHYPNGNSVPLVTDNAEWGNLEDNNIDDAYSFYEDITSDEIETYGALYTWSAAMGDNPDSSEGIVQGVCPDGWHLPSDEEWKELEIELGMSQSHANYEGFRGTNEGSKLATNRTLWFSDDLIDDFEFGISGFAALPAGLRYSIGGECSQIGLNTFF